MEILGSAIRGNENIRGINVGKTEVKLLQYADDTNGFLHDVHSAKEFMRTVDIFGEFSGLEINKQKTEGMWLGANRNNVNKPLGIHWSERPVKVLGIYLSYDTALSVESKFEAKIVKIGQILNMWRQHNLSLYGRIQIVKTFIISQFMYTLSAMSMPQEVVQKLNKQIWTFIWKGKKERLSRKKMRMQPENGGLCAPDVFSIVEAAKITWVKRYLSPNTHVWKQCFEQFLWDANLDPIILKCNFSTKNVQGKLKSEFYTDILKLWSKLGNTTPIEKEQCIWYNKEILIGSQTVYYKNFSDVGINYVGDLYRANRTPKTFQFWLSQGLQKGDYLKWLGLTKATKKLLVNCNKEDEDAMSVTTCTIGVGHKEKKMLEVLTKDVYQMLTCEILSTSAVKPRVARYLDTDTENINWQDIFSFVKLNTVDTKSKEFQFMFLHDILPTKYWLYKWKIEDDDRCTFCNSHTETLSHLFWDCVHVKALWLEIEIWVKQIMDHQINIDKETVFLGCKSALLHTLITVAKRHIFQSRCKKKQPNMNLYHANVRSLMKTEIYIARRNHKQIKLLDKWEALQVEFLDSEH